MFDPLVSYPTFCIKGINVTALTKEQEVADSSWDGVCFCSDGDQ